MKRIKYFQRCLFYTPFIFLIGCGISRSQMGFSNYCDQVVGKIGMNNVINDTVIIMHEAVFNSLAIDTFHFREYPVKFNDEIKENGDIILFFDSDVGTTRMYLYLNETKKYGKLTIISDIPPYSRDFESNDIFVKRSGGIGAFCSRFNVNDSIGSCFILDGYFGVNN